MYNKGHRTMVSRTMVVTDYHKERTIGNIQKEGTMKFPTRWLCCTGKRSCESRSCDHKYILVKKEKKIYGPSAQEHNMMPFLESCYHATNKRLCKTPCQSQCELALACDIG